MRTTPARAAGSSRRAIDQLLLAQLLGVVDQPAAPDAQADEQLLRELLLAPPPLLRTHAWRTVLLLCTAMLALLLCVPLAFAANSLLAIRNNVAAMRQPALDAAAPLVDGPGITNASQPTERISKGAGARSRQFRLPDTAGLPVASSAPSASPIQAAAPAAAPSGAAAAQRDLSTIDVRPVAAPSAAPEAAITVLLLGVDRRPGQSGPARADSVIVARIDPQAGRVALVSLPRDLQVEIPGIGWDRINATTVYGDMYPELGGSLELARRTVEQLLGIPIDHAVSIDFSGFISAVDALGGITVDVEREVYDSYTENYFAAGEQHMDGRTALWYSRIRFLDSDFERMRRQQAVLLGLLHRIREQNVLQQLHSIAAVTDALRGYIQTDLPEQRMVRLAWSLRGFAPEAVEQYRLEVDQVDIFVNAADPYAQYIRPGAVDSLVRKLLGSAP